MGPFPSTASRHGSGQLFLALAGRRLLQAFFSNILGMIRTRVAESVDDTSEKFRPDGNVDDLSGSLDGVSLLDGPVGSEDGDSNLRTRLTIR